MPRSHDIHVQYAEYCTHPILSLCGSVVLHNGAKISLPQSIDINRLRNEVAKRSESISKNYKLLNAILERHEACIHKKWKNKGNRNRAKLLLDAWPEMPANHRPDVEAYQKKTLMESQDGATRKSALMWPNINVADLSKSQTLLLFFNARGRTPPYDFAAADSEAMHIGLASKMIMPVWSDQCTITLKRTLDSQAYATVSATESFEAFLENTQSLGEFLTGEGLLILEAQDRTMSFLVACAQAILHPLSPASVLSDEYPPQPEPALPPSKQMLHNTFYDSLATFAVEAAYRPPSRLDMPRIQTLLVASASAAEDHLWALREDPDYFATIMFDQREHRYEVILDEFGKTHLALQPNHEDNLWSRIIKTVVQIAHTDFEWFTLLAQMAGDLVKLHQTHMTSITTEEALPEDFLCSLLIFRYVLIRVMQDQLAVLRAAAMASRPLRAFHMRKHDSDLSATETYVRSLPVGGHTAQDVIWLLHRLWEDGDDISCTKFCAMMDQLEYLIQSVPEAKILITEHVSMLLGKLSVVAECLRQLELYQPWANSFDSAYKKRKEQLLRSFASKNHSRMRVIYNLGVDLEDERLLEASRLGNPMDGRFRYPSEKPHTKQNVEILRKAEAKLDAFWAKVDDYVFAHAKLVRQSASAQVFSGAKVLHRTPAWTESPPVSSTAENLKVPAQNLGIPLFNQHPDGEPNDSTSGRKLARQSTPKPKAKTRGIPDKLRGSLKEDQISRQVQRSSTEPKVSILVDRRAYNVFSTLFFNHEVTSRPGPVPWTEFLHALAWIGFSAEHLYGSVWHFQPSRSLEEKMKNTPNGCGNFSTRDWNGAKCIRPIQFHSPHPSKEIPYRKARRHGRRLNRAYGWTHETFKLEGKNKEKNKTGDGKDEPSKNV